MLQAMSLWGGLAFAFFYGMNQQYLTGSHSHTDHVDSLVNSTSLPEILEVVYNFGATQRGISYLAWCECIANVLERPRLTLCSMWHLHRALDLQFTYGPGLQWSY